MLSVKKDGRILPTVPDNLKIIGSFGHVHLGALNFFPLNHNFLKTHFNLYYCYGTDMQKFLINSFMSFCS